MTGDARRSQRPVDVATPTAVGARADAAPRVRGSGLGVDRSPRSSALFGWAVGLAKLTDNSFFWHLRTGEYILDHGIPHHDVFSFTAPGTKWVAQSWLAEVTYGVAVPQHRRASASGCSSALVGAGIGMLAYRLALRLVRDRLVACGLTAAALAGDLHRLVGAAAADRRALPPRAALDRRGARQLRRPPPAGRRAGADVAVGEHARHVRSSGSRTSGLHLLGRWVDGAPPWEGRERTLLVGAVDRVRRGVREPVRRRARDVPDRSSCRAATSCRTSSSGSRPTSARRGASRSASGSWCSSWRWRAVATGSRGATSIVAVPMLLLALWARPQRRRSRRSSALPVVARAFARDEEKPSELRGTMVAAAITVLVLAAVMMGYQASTEKNFDFATYPVASMRYLERHDLMGKHLLTTDAAAGYVILEDCAAAEGVHRRPLRHVPDVGDLRLLRPDRRQARMVTRARQVRRRRDRVGQGQQRSPSMLDQSRPVAAGAHRDAGDARLGAELDPP